MDFDSHSTGTSKDGFRQSFYVSTSSPLPPGPIHDKDVDNSIARSNPDWRIPNNQLKNACLNKCQKIEAAGFLCGDKR